jgi:hypothetical protein
MIIARRHCILAGYPHAEKITGRAARNQAHDRHPEAKQAVRMWHAISAGAQQSGRDGGSRKYGRDEGPRRRNRHCIRAPRVECSSMKVLLGPLLCLTVVFANVQTTKEPDVPIHGPSAEKLLSDCSGISK